MTYFKHSGIGDSVARIIEEIETEPSTDTRAELLCEMMDAISGQLAGSLERICFAMKMSGKPSDVIAIKLGISERSVKRLIRKRSASLGVRNPLEQISVSASVDIRDLVKI